MKILAINGSPRMKNSNTDKILNPLLEGAEEAGAGVERFYARKLDIAHCKGCFSCWLKTPGSCVQDADDARMVREKFMEADLAVLATPVYFWHMTAYLKILMERVFMPLSQPFMVEVDGVGRHLARYPEKTFRFLLVANAGFWGREVFEPLTHSMMRSHMTMVDEDGKGVVESVGAILLAGGEFLAEDLFQPQFEPLYAELKKAGVELVREGSLSPESLEKLNVPVYEYLNLDAAQATKMANTYFEHMLKQT